MRCLLTAILAFLLWQPAAHAADQAWTDCTRDKGREKNWDRVIAGCTRILARGDRETDENRAVALYNRANGYSGKKDQSRALADFDQSIRLDPNYSDAYYNRAAVLADAGDHDRAIADYDQVIRLNPQAADAYHNRGASFAKKGDHDRAIADYDQAIRLDPKAFDSYRNRGARFFDKGSYDRAIADYDQAIRLKPRDADSHAALAEALARTSLLDRALAEADEAIRRDAKLSEARSYRGYVLARQGRLGEAAKAVDEAILLNATSPDGHLYRGEVHLLAGDPERAAASFARALELKQNFRLAREGLDKARGVIAARTQSQVVAEPAPKVSVQPAPKVDPSLKVESAPKVEPVPKAEPARPAPPPVLAATPGRRVALVVGNGAYRHAGALTNPPNDATDFSAALRGLGFDVVEGRDLTADRLRIAVRDFTRKLDGADLALFFYAGHAVQVAGVNYLVPIDAELQSAADLDFGTIDVSRIVGSMESETRVSLVLLDACRDNPFNRSLQRSLGTRSSGLGRGLARIPVAPATGGFGATAGTLVAFATQPDNVALDGEGRNSPFTAALLKHIRTPGLEIEQLMRRVRTEVAAATKGKQIPRHDSGIVGGDVVLLAGSP